MYLEIPPKCVTPRILESSLPEPVTIEILGRSALHPPSSEFDFWTCPVISKSSCVLHWHCLCRVCAYACSIHAHVSARTTFRMGEGRLSLYSTRQREKGMTRECSVSNRVAHTYRRIRTHTDAHTLYPFPRWFSFIERVRCTRATRQVILWRKVRRKGSRATIKLS